MTLGEAKAKLQQIVSSLETVRSELLSLEAALPDSSMETDRDLDVDEMDEATRLRSVVQCVLRDSLQPALEDLRSLTDPSGLRRRKNGRGGRGRSR